MLIYNNYTFEIVFSDVGLRVRDILHGAYKFISEVFK